MPVHPQARRRGGDRHLRRGILDPLERLGKLEFPLPGPDGPDVGGGHRPAVAGLRPGVVREARPDGNEQHERAVLLRAGTLPWLGVTVSVNPLNKFFVRHNG